ncbi:MAG: hypothetical protein AAB575_04575 [Patescibacteria group bacterium]
MDKDIREFQRLSAIEHCGINTILVVVLSLTTVATVIGTIVLCILRPDIAVGLIGLLVVMFLAQVITILHAINHVIQWTKYCNQLPKE